MKVTLEEDILAIAYEDLPKYKKGGSIVRNSYFWALKSIACYSSRGQDWEYGGTHFYLFFQNSDRTF